MAYGLIAIIILAAVADPYARGGVGLDVRGVIHPWQVGASLLSVLLLALAAVAIKKQALGAGMALLGTELSVFTLVNAVLLTRDGMMRFSTGYEGSTRTLWVLLVAAGLRAALLSVLSRNRKRQSLP